MSSSLAIEFQHYLANQNDMVEKYDGKVVGLKTVKSLAYMTVS